MSECNIFECFLFLEFKMFQERYKLNKRKPLCFPLRILFTIILITLTGSLYVVVNVKQISDKRKEAINTDIDFRISECKKFQTYESTTLINSKIFGEESYYLISGSPEKTVFRPYCEPANVLSDKKNHPNKFQIGMIKCAMGPCEPVDRYPIHRKTVICMAPLYGKKIDKWLIEWLNYHAEIGFEHVHIPVFEISKKARDVLEHYQQHQFVTIEDWSTETTERISSHNYEHGKLEAWNSCMMEYVENTDWMLFIDVDELYVPGTTLEDALKYYSGFGSNTIGFAMHSTTTTSTFNKVKNSSSLIGQYQNVEAQPLCPYNCGEYHKGRQKYMLRGGELPKHLLWTHAIGGLDYSNIAQKIMVQIPKSISSIRHYSGWWYVHHGEFRDEIYKSVYEPLPRHVIQGIHIRIHTYPNIEKIYKDSIASLPWVKKVLKEPNFENFRRSSKCPEQPWLEDIVRVTRLKDITIVSVGCNKGLDLVRTSYLFGGPIKGKKWWDTIKSIEPRIDCGACGQCETTNNFHQVEKKKVTAVCIEPLPANTKILKAGCDRLNMDWFKVIEAAGSNSDGGTVEFPDNQKAGTEHIGQIMFENDPSHKAQDKYGTIKVPVVSVDGLVEKGTIKTVDVLMIDVEGFDPRVLHGAWKILPAVRYLEFEYHEVGLWRHTQLKTVITELYNAFSFDCFLEGKGQLWPLFPWEDKYEFKRWSNVLCLKHNDPWFDFIRPYIINV